MKKLIATAALLLALPMFASAQTSEHCWAQGYLFFAPGVVWNRHETGVGSATVHLGGGGEGFIYRGLGVGAEIGYMALWSRFNDGPGVGSVNASYHFHHRATAGSIEPFVTAGYTLFFRAGTSGSANFGGGINYWLARQGAVRFEARYQATHAESYAFGGADRIIEFRVGVTWR